MAKIIHKKSSVADKSPLTTDLDYGEMALNYNDGKLFYKNSSNVIKSFIDSDNIKISIADYLNDGSLTSINFNNNTSLVDSANSLYILDSVDAPKFIFDTTNGHLEVINTIAAGGNIDNTSGGSIQTNELRIYGPSTVDDTVFGDFRINASDVTGDIFIRQYVGDFISIRDSANSNIFAIYTNSSTSPGEIIITNTMRPEFSTTVSDLGTSVQRFQDIYLENSPNVSSDINVKSDIQDVTESERIVASNLKGLVKKFKYNKAIDKKGFDEARYHFGVIAQDVMNAFTEQGLDWSRYGIICYGEQQETDDRFVKVYSVRYEELLAFIISSL